MIREIFRTLKRSFARFAGMYVLCICASIFASIGLLTSNRFFIPFVLDFSAMILGALLLKLWFEKVFPVENKHSISARALIHGIPVLLSVPFYFFCTAYKSSEYFPLIYGVIITVLISCIGFFIADEAKEKNLLNIFFSYFIAAILSACVGASLSLIIFAIDKLLVPMDEMSLDFIEIVWIVSGYIIFIGTFVSGITKKYGDINISKPFKVIFLYALLPLFAVYILVLYIYFIKSLFTLTMPSGLINPFVSAATCIYMILYLTLKPFKNPVTDFFYKAGAIFMLPLIALQISGYAIRVSAYGVTSARYLSFFYILFSLAFTCLAFFKGTFRKNIQIYKIVFLILAGLSVFICLPKINMFDFCNESMRHQIEKIYESHGLFENGLLVTENASSIFSADEKNQIRDIYWQFDKKASEKIPWYKHDDDYYTNFEKTFGFENHWYTGTNYYKGCDYTCPKEKFEPVDISGYKNLYSIRNAEFKPEPKPTLKISIASEQDKKTFILDDELESYLKYPFEGETTILDEPLVFDIDEDTRIILSILEIAINSYASSDGTHKYAAPNISGYVLKK